MKRILSDVKIIGLGLAALYGAALCVFLGTVRIPGDDHFRTLVFIILCGTLFICSLAVILLKDWGRRLIVALNGIMFLSLVTPYIPKLNLIPVYFIFINIVVFLYFSQEKVRMQFQDKNKKQWKSILVVDDDEIHLKTVRHILMTQGYSVLAANSGEYGLQIAKTQTPDLIILDVILPGIKGREVCKRLKSDPTTKEIPVMFLTSKDSPDDIQAEFDLGAIRHLTKPVNAKILTETVKEIFK